MPDIMANGIRIHYERTGGDKPPVVLCHGVNGSSRCWPRVEAALKPAYDLIMLDARGHGCSEAPPAGYSLDVFADDVAAVVTALGLEQPAAIGHSLGAWTVAKLAACYPRLVRCIILEDPPWRDREHTAEEWTAMVNGMRANAAAWKSMTTAEEMVAAESRINPGVALWDAVDVASFIEAKRNVSLNVFDSMRAAPWRWRDTVPRITCPALLLTGDAARAALKPEVAEQVQVLNPRIESVSIPQVGHYTRCEGFAAYIDAVSTFLHAHMTESKS